MPTIVPFSGAVSLRVVCGALFLLLGTAPAATAQMRQARPPTYEQRKLPSDAARRASAFLQKLESGQAQDVKSAYGMLDSDVRRGYGYPRLAAVASERSRSPGQPQLSYERQLSSAEAAAYLAAGSSPHRPYIACFVERPPGGRGTVTYISVVAGLRIFVSRSDWMIVDFRITSEPHHLCR